MKKRTFMAAAAAYAGSGFALAAAPKPAGVKPAAAKSIAEHFVPGGLGNVVRGRYGFTGTDKDNGYKIISFPKDGPVYQVPLSVQEFDESNGGRYAFTGDGTVTIQQTGMYIVSCNLDWPGQRGRDVNLRKLLIYRVPVGTATPGYPGTALPIIKGSASYDALAAHDTPGSNVPKYARGSAAVNLVTLAPGAQFTFPDIVFDTGDNDTNIGYLPVVGDVVSAGHSKLADPSVVLRGAVVAASTVRIVAENRGTTSVTIPAGTLNVMTQSPTELAGVSSDGWAGLSSPPVYLLQGEKVMVAVRVNTPGDYIQVDNVSFLQVSSLA